MDHVQTDSTQVVTLTEAAQAEISRLIREEEEDVGLRMGVSGGGCSGFSYVLGFTAEYPGDHVMELDSGVRVYLDQKSLLYLKGTLLDFQDGLSGKGFVFNNPNATNTCGCGESFSA